MLKQYVQLVVFMLIGVDKLKTASIAGLKVLCVVATCRALGWATLNVCLQVNLVKFSPSH